MRTFLVPVDFSAASRNAAIYAAQLAKKFDAGLILFHAYMLPTPVSEVPYVMVTADELQKENEALIQEDAHTLSRDYGVSTETIVRIGIASDEIKFLTQEKSVDLIIMGMKGAGGIEKMIGSTTTNVIRKTKAPVLIVPHDAGFAEIKNVAYASDFSYDSHVQLFNPLIKLCQQFSANLNILHVQLNHGGTAAGIQAGKAELDKIFTGVTHNFSMVEDSTVTQGINQFLSKTPCQMITMVAHKHSFLERIFSRNHTTDMAYETHVPMLVLQDK